MRIAQVGMRPKPFCSVIFNEGELMEKFGLQIVPVNLAVIIDKYNKILAENDAELEAGAKLLLSRYEMDDLTPPLLKKVYAFVLLYQWVFETYNVQAVSAECWTAMQLGVGAMPCTAYSVLAGFIGCVMSLLRERPPRRHFHGAAVRRLHGQEDPLLRRVHRAAS